MLYGSQEFAQRLKAIIQDQYRHPKYADTKKHAEEMGVHIYGEVPDHLINRLRPREEQEVKDYRIESFEPITKASAGKAIDITSKMFNPNLYSIRFKEENSETEEMRAYTFEYYPDFNSLINYNKELGLRQTIADPNAIQCVKPGIVPISDMESPEPVIVIYGACSVWDYDFEHYLAFIREEKEDTTTYYYFDYYDGNQFIHFYTWYDAAAKAVFMTPEQVYVHSFDEIPVWFLKGIPRSLPNGEYMYESYFSPALAHWNMAIMHESDLIGAFVGHMHPQKYVYTTECEYQFKYEGNFHKCYGGVIKYTDKNGEKHSDSCPQCSGTGRTQVKGPHQEYLFDQKKLSEGEISQIPVGYIAVPTEATSLLVTRTDDMHRKAMWALNMDIEDRIGENQSGVAKVIDRSAQQDTIFNIACNMFDHQLTNQFYFIEKYKFQTKRQSMGDTKKNPNLPEIVKPTVIDILSQSDLVNNFKVATESNLDKNYLKQKQIEIINRDPSLNPDQKAYLITNVDLDPLSFFSQADIDLGVNKGVIRKVDWTIHNNIKPFVDRAMSENKAFIDMDRLAKITLLEKYANELIEGEKPRIEEDMAKVFEMKNPDVAA